MCVGHVRPDFAKEEPEAQKGQAWRRVAEADRPKAGPRLPPVSCRDLEKPQTLLELVSSAENGLQGEWGRR